MYANSKWISATAGLSARHHNTCWQILQMLSYVDRDQCPANQPGSPRTALRKILHEKFSFVAISYLFRCNWVCIAYTRLVFHVKWIWPSFSYYYYYFSIVYSRLFSLLYFFFSQDLAVTHKFIQFFLSSTRLKWLQQPQHNSKLYVIHIGLVRRRCVCIALALT